MNWFKLYIGDYQRDTAHLSVTEHGAYLLMLQHYYATEKPLPIGKALHRMLRAQDKEEREAIDSVAAQFWTATDAGLVNDRADAEITKAGTQADTNREIALAREAARKAAREAERQEHESCTNRSTNDQPNQTPDTRHQTPRNTEIPARKRAAPVGAVCPDDVPDDVWRDWNALRKAKRATVSPTVIAEARAEADKAGMTLEAFLRVWCVRGSQGLQAEWLKPNERISAEPAWHREKSERMAQFAGPAAAKPKPSMEVIDVTPRLVG